MATSIDALMDLLDRQKRSPTPLGANPPPEVAPEELAPPPEAPPAPAAPSPVLAKALGLQGYGPELDDAALKAAKAEDAKNNALGYLGSILQNATDRYVTARTGRSPGPAIQAPKSDKAGELLAMRQASDASRARSRALVRDEREDVAYTQGEAQRQAKKDPNSPAAKFLQGALVKAGVLTQDQAAGLTIEQAEGIPFLKDYVAAALKAQEEGRERDFKAGENQKDRDSREKEARIKAAQASGPGLVSTAIDNAAQLYHETRILPSRFSPADKKAIMNREAEMYGRNSIAGNAAGLKADAGSLASLQKNADATKAFEKTARQNLKQFLEAAKGMRDTGSPLFNAPLRKLDEMRGDPAITAAKTARQVAVTEIGRVLAGANSSVLSDSARHEVAELIRGDASMKQIEAAANILLQDMENRSKSYDEELAGIRARMSGGGATGEASTSQGTERKTVNGKTYEKRADGWYEVK